MTEEEYKQMKADREAGTQGEFTFNGVRMIRADGKALAVIVTPHGNTVSDEADGRRIANISNMEAEIIRLRNHLRIILDSKDLPASEGYFKQPEYYDI